MKKVFLTLLAVLISVTGAWAVMHSGYTINLDFVFSTYASVYAEYPDSLAVNCVLQQDGVMKIEFIDTKLGKTITTYPSSIAGLLNCTDYADYKVLNPEAASMDYFVATYCSVDPNTANPKIARFQGRFSGFYTKQELAESLDAINAAATYKLSTSVLTTYKNNILNAAIADARGLYDSYVEQIKHLLHVVYNPNASGIGSAKTDDIIISGSIKGNQFTRTGYTFTEWNTQADGSGTIYNPGDIIDVSDNGEFVLYAQWTANQYTVTFDRQNGEGGSDNITATYDAPMPQIEIPTREYYAFLGYFSQPNGAGIKYYNADGTSARVWNVANNTTALYAQWTVNQCTITFDKQNGEGGSDNVVATYDADMPQITLPTLSGYKFLGYFSQPNGAGTKYYNADGTSAHLWDIANITTTLYAQWNKPLHYIDADGSVKFIAEYSTITNESSTLTEGWYVVNDVDVQTGMLVCEGDVHLMLADGAKLTTIYDEWNADAGIRVSAEGASLTIYGQQNQSGQLIANGGNMGPGIGGHDITINGGVIHATGGDYASGIGGGKDGAGHDITINGGVIHATGGSYASGIGGGDGADGYNITINGGVIYAAGSSIASGIGGGDGADGHNITINGGVIHATGGSYASGIGGGFGAAGHDITINGGEIHATGGDYASGIGGGDGADGYNITINGGVIYAAGSGFASGIGGGSDGVGHDITINGGVTYATTGSTDASAIGGGRIGVAFNIFINEALILKAGDNEQSETEIEHFSIDEDLTEVLIEKRYATLAFPSVNLNHASDMNANFGTFYHAYAAYTLPNEDATIYTAAVETVNNETCLVLHEIEGGVIPAATPVILRTDETTTIDLQPCTDASGIHTPRNSLSGTNLPESTPDNSYILSAQVLNGVTTTGFYRYTRSTIPAHKAYLRIPVGQQAPTRILWDERGAVTGGGIATGIEQVATEQVEKFVRGGQLFIRRGNHVYDMHGRLITNDHFND